MGTPQYMNEVKKIHESGGFGSKGYNYDWKEEEAGKNILRTHTTAISSQMLYKMATSKEGFKPFKYFSIDRVFRNETLDATHLAEFHQIEVQIHFSDLKRQQFLIGGDRRSRFDVRRPDWGSLPILQEARH